MWLDGSELLLFRHSVERLDNFWELFSGKTQGAILVSTFQRFHYWLCSIHKLSPFNFSPPILSQFIPALNESDYENILLFILDWNHCGNTPSASKQMNVNPKKCRKHESPKRIWHIIDKWTIDYVIQTRTNSPSSSSIISVAHNKPMAKQEPAKNAY